MSKIAIIGATGRAGSQLLEEALRRGHRVLAIARDPSTLEGREGVTVKSLDATDSAALQAAVAGMDAVLSAAHFSTMEPHAIIESSEGKHHAYWLVDGLPVDQFTAVQKAIVLATALPMTAQADSLEEWLFALIKLCIPIQSGMT